MTRNVAGLLSLVALLAVAGCGGGYDSPSAEAESAPAAEATTTPAAMQTTEAVPEKSPVTKPDPATTTPAAMQTTEAVPEKSPVTKPDPATITDEQLLTQTAPVANPAAVDGYELGKTKGSKAQVADAAKLAPSTLKVEPARLDLGKVSTNKNATGTVQSTLKVEPARLDLGKVSTNKNATGTVHLVNAGTAPITIQECKSSCGCTSTNCPKGKELQPGESADVDIRVSGGARARRISKTVTFRVVDQQPVILPVSVEVIAYVTIEPLTIDPEKVPDGKVVIKATDGQPFRITNMTPPVIAEFTAEPGVEHEIFLDWDTWRELGQGRRLVFNVDHPDASQVTTIVRATPVRRSQAENPIQRTKDRLRESGVVDAPLEEPAPPAKAAIAVKLGQVDEIKTQLSVGLSEAQRNDLLNLAARHGQVEVMGVLVEAGAKPTATDKRGRTPLMAAVQSHKPEAIRFLIDNGADVNARDQLQGTALVRAAGPFGSLESVQVLLSAGAEVNVQDKNGMTPLMWAARWGDA
ncbi:MAG: ankyrin repeat domain-containing protein, partial [Planctomycetota bacterium]